MEDACYSNHEHHGPLEMKSRDKAGRSCDGLFLNNSLGLTLAKIASHVYSLGEGYDTDFKDKLYKTNLRQIVFLHLFLCTILVEFAPCKRAVEWF